MLGETKGAEEEAELNTLKMEGKGRVSNVFSIVKSIQGPKKGGGMEAHAVADPDSDKIAVTAKDIKSVSLEYCRKVLKNNSVKETVAKEIALKEKLHEERMNSCGKGFMITKELFNKVIEKFRKNNKRNYDFLIRTGERFKDAVFKLAKRMLEEEVFLAVLT